MKGFQCNNRTAKNSRENRTRWLLFLIVVTTLTICISQCKGDTDGIDAENDIFSDGLNTKQLSKQDELYIVSKEEWLAEQEIHSPNQLKRPVSCIIIHHTATENCSTSTQCAQNVREIQILHIKDRGWWDIGYNFLVGGDGLVYEGRGWKNEGAHLRGYNSKSIGIGFIGNFEEITPTEKQILAGKKLIEKGVEKGFIDKSYELIAAKQLNQNTVSPGEQLYNIIKSWPHWIENPSL